MTIDEFLAHVRNEPPRDVPHSARVPSPEALAKLAKSGHMTLREFTSQSRETERTSTRYGHVLGPGAQPEQVADAWRRLSPVPLAADLQHLVERINGVHLWANMATGRSYVGLAPVDEWERARTKMYGLSADPALLDDRFIAVSYHQDGAAFVVVDARTGTYYLMDSAGPDTSSPIGRNAEALLSWLWESRVLPHVP